MRRSQTIIGPSSIGVHGGLGASIGVPGGVGLGVARAALALDNIESAVLAFSVSRKLRTAYTGSAIRVRRSSDDTEQDIGFVDNALDTASLESFAGAGDAYITKVYEQSGHAAAVDYAQTTAASQPQIVASGSVITKDGKVAMESPDGGEEVNVTGWSTRPSDCVLLQVSSAPASRLKLVLAGSASVAAYIVLMEDGDSSTVLLNDNGGSTASLYKNGSVFAGSTRDDAHTFYCDGSLLIARVNGLNLSSDNFSDLSTGLGSVGTNSRQFISEQIILSDASEVAALEANIASRYGISI